MHHKIIEANKAAGLSSSMGAFMYSYLEMIEYTKKYRENNQKKIKEYRKKYKKQKDINNGKINSN